MHMKHIQKTTPKKLPGERIHFPDGSTSITFIPTTVTDIHQMVTVRYIPNHCENPDTVRRNN